MCRRQFDSAIRVRRADRARAGSGAHGATRPLGEIHRQPDGHLPETVRMHRKNLYLKLEVNSQSELFALFIEWLRKH
jgi:hypothetical protein